MKQVQDQIWQHFPTKNQSRRHHTIEGCKSFASLKLFESHFPNLRFSCPSCGTLDVFVSRKKGQKALQANCLDCKKTWSEEVNLPTPYALER